MKYFLRCSPQAVVLATVALITRLSEQNSVALASVVTLHLRQKDFVCVTCGTVFSKQPIK